jgi:hypothetical protein
VVVPHGDIAATQAVLAEILAGSFSPGPADWSYIRAFARHELTGKLARVLDEVALPQRRPPVQTRPIEGGR